MHGDRGGVREVPTHTGLAKKLSQRTEAPTEQVKAFIREALSDHTGQSPLRRIWVETTLSPFPFVPFFII